MLTCWQSFEFVYSTLVLLLYTNVVYRIKKEQIFRYFSLFFEIVQHLVASLRFIDGQPDHVVDQTFHTG